MVQQVINIGTNPNDGTGDNLRTGATKVNANFTDLYSNSYAGNVVNSFNTRVGAVTLTMADVTSALTYTPLNKAGDTATGEIIFSNGLLAIPGTNGVSVSSNAANIGSLPALSTSLARFVGVDATSALIGIDSFVTSGNPNSTITLRGARGTGASPTAVQNGDFIGTISANGYGASSFCTNAPGSIHFVSEGNFTNSSYPTAISFNVTATNSTIPSEVMRITSSGAVTIESSMVVNGTVSGTGIASYLASPPPIGSTTANTGTFSNLILNSGIASSGNISLRYAVPTTQISVNWQSNGSSRWFMQNDGSAESGSNAGSNFQISRFNDSGAFIDNPMFITRSTGIVSFTDGITNNGTLTGFPGRLLNVQVFTVSGTYTKTTGTNSIIVEVQAPGGGSGGTNTTGASQVAIGGGGGAGTYAKVYYSSASTGVTVTIGAAGAAGTAGNAGGTGGTTSFGSFISCPGGLGGNAGAAVANTSGQTNLSSGAIGYTGASTISGGTTLVNVFGSRGEAGYVINGAALFGGGGGAPLGSWAFSYGSAITPGGFGSGACGMITPPSTSGQAGAPGATGVIIVYEYS